MDGIFGRVFGPCFRGWIQPAPTNGNKYIDYAPNRKWKYDDKNLIKELTKDQVNSWDVMDLNEDEDLDIKIASNGKLQLHDNVFINPLGNDEDNNNAEKENQDVVVVAEEPNPVIEEAAYQPEKPAQNESFLKEESISNETILNETENKIDIDNDVKPPSPSTAIEIVVDREIVSTSSSSSEEVVVVDEEVKLVVDGNEDPE